MLAVTSRRHATIVSESTRTWLELEGELYFAPESQVDAAPYVGETVIFASRV
jgi:hypothetical protein